MENIDDLYQLLLPRLERLEAHRLEVNKKVKTIQLVSLAAGAATAFAASYLFQFFGGLLVGAVIGLAGYAWLYHRVVTPFKKDYKTSIFRELIDALGTGYRYLPRGGFSEAELRRSGLFPPFTKAECEDLIERTGQHQGFRLAELRLQKKSSNRHGSNNIQVFKGLYLMGSLPEKLPADLMILLQTGEDAFFPDRVEDHWETVSVEYLAFSKAYEVYSNKPEAATSLLRPEFMDAVLMARDRLVYDDRMHLEVALKDNQLYVAFRTPEDLFEPSLSAPMTDYDMFASNLRFIVYITGLLDTLRSQI